MYCCDFCSKPYATREGLQFLFTKGVADPAGLERLIGRPPSEADLAPRQYSWVVCQEVCADKVRNDEGTVAVMIDEPFAG